MSADDSQPKRKRQRVDSQPPKQAKPKPTKKPNLAPIERERETVDKEGKKKKENEAKKKKDIESDDNRGNIEILNDDEEHIAVPSTEDEEDCEMEDKENEGKEKEKDHIITVVYGDEVQQLPDHIITGVLHVFASPETILHAPQMNDEVQQLASPENAGVNAPPQQLPEPMDTDDAEMYTEQISTAHANEMNERDASKEVLDSDKIRLQELVSCHHLLTEFMNSGETEPFNEPVDWKGLNLPDYRQIITKPMDLGTVANKLECHKYLTADQFASDVRLVFKNAKAYNKVESGIHLMADSLLEQFERRYARITARITKNLPAKKRKSMEENESNGHTMDVDATGENHNTEEKENALNNGLPQAYVSYCLPHDDASILCSSVLALTLKKCSKGAFKRVLLLPSNACCFNPSGDLLPSYQFFNSLWDELIKFEYSDEPNHYLKVQALRLIQFKKVIFIEPMSIVNDNNVDTYFEELAASSAFLDQFDVMVIEPNMDTYLSVCRAIYSIRRDGAHLHKWNTMEDVHNIIIKKIQFDSIGNDNDKFLLNVKKKK
eukprot:945221_1